MTIHHRMHQVAAVTLAGLITTLIGVMFLAGATLAGALVTRVATDLHSPLSPTLLGTIVGAAAAVLIGWWRGGDLVWLYRNVHAMVLHRSQADRS